jgi:hypothetical protein
MLIDALANSKIIKNNQALKKVGCKNTGCAELNCSG